MSEFIPNSTTFPNVFTDQYMDLLTSNEWKVLSYLVRRTFGFHKLSDSIAFSQFCTGITTRDGKRLDGGTGLSEAAVKNALANLVTFGLVVREQENDPAKNEGVLWRLQLEDSAVNVTGLKERREKAAQDYKARAQKAEKKVDISQTPTSMTDDLPPSQAPRGGICQTPHNIVEQNSSIQNTRTTGAEAPKRISRTSAQKKGDYLDCLLAFQTPDGFIDVGDYPPDIQEILGEICRLWGLRPPSRSSKEFSQWIVGGRALFEACGEFGLAILQDVYANWSSVPEDQRFTVGWPGALVKTSRAKAGQMRIAKQKHRQIVSRLKPDGSEEFLPDGYESWEQLDNSRKMFMQNVEAT